MALTVMHKKEAHDVSQNIKKMDDHWFIPDAQKSRHKHVNNMETLRNIFHILLMIPH